MKESDNPPLFWPEVESIGEFRGIWWVAHTKSRNEKALAQDLIRKDISYFLPMSWSVRRIRKRTVRSLLPLFKGYLFFCGDEDQRVELFSPAWMRMTLFDIRGHLLNVIFNEALVSGDHKIPLDLHIHSTGIYILQCSMHGQTEQIKIMLMK